MITRFKLFEKKEDEELKKFLFYFDKYKKEYSKSWIFTKENDNYKLPEEIREEIEIYLYLYMDYRDYNYWGKNFDNMDHNRIKNKVKRYLKDRIVKKWNENTSLYNEINNNLYLKFFRRGDYLQAQTRYIFNVLNTLTKNYKPKILQAVDNFNI